MCDFKIAQVQFEITSMISDQNCMTQISIDLFSVVCLVTWPLNESEAGVDLIQTFLLFLC